MEIYWLQFTIQYYNTKKKLPLIKMSSSLAIKHPLQKSGRSVFIFKNPEQWQMRAEWLSLTFFHQLQHL